MPKMIAAKIPRMSSTRLSSGFSLVYFGGYFSDRILFSLLSFFVSFGLFSVSLKTIAIS